MRKLLHAARASLVLMLFLIGANSTWAQTYCTSVVSSGCSNGATINSFYTTGAYYNIVNIGTNCGGSGAINYTDMVATAAPGMVIGVNGQIIKYSGGVKIWIDWNEDGDFEDTDEAVFATTSTISATSSFVGSFTVPAAATAGSKRMRVKVVESTTTFTPCTTSGWGETEDYTFEVITGPACSTTGVTTVVATGPAEPICAALPYSVSAEVTSLGTGLTMQWQSRNPSGTGIWTNISGATGSPYYDADGLAGGAGDTDFRLIVTCTVSGDTDTSNMVTVEAAEPAECYCTPTPLYTWWSGCSSFRIDNFVTTGGIDNISNLNSNCAGSSAYDDNTTDPGMVASQWQGFPINYTIRNEYTWGSGATAYTRMWVDWNQDGVFSSDESVLNTPSPVSTTTDLTGTFEVPATAVGGTTRLRIMMGANYPITDPCLWGTWEGNGEVEDYTFNVLVPDPCEDVAMTSVTITGPESVCSGAEAFTISSSGGPIASGLTRVWESRSPAGSGTWTTIAGASSSFLSVTSISAETEYRFTITCTATGESTTDTWTVGMNPPTECYCEPTLGYGCSYSRITDFSTSGATIDITNLDNGCGGSDGSSTGGYSDFSDMEAEAFQGTVVNFDIGLYHAYQSARMWIDWDQNGSFDSDEIVYQNSSSGYAPMAISGSFEVPFDAVAGVTGIRVRTFGYYWGYDYLNACYSYTWGEGETEDYRINVVVPPPCDEVAFTGLEIEGPSSICAANTFIITSTGTPIASGITRIWQSKTATGAWTTMAGTPLNYTVTGGITEEMSYRYINICTLNGESDTSNVIVVSLNPPLECYCVAEFSEAYYMDIYTWNEYKIKDVLLNGDTDSLKSLNTPFTFEGGMGDLGGYTDYTDSTGLGLPDMTQTGTYTGQVKLRLSWPEQAVRIWIDYDDDGVFETSESIYASPTSYPALSSSLPANFSVTIPADATPGIHRMRVRTVSIYASPSIYSGIDPCLTYTYGQTQDYLVEVKELKPCDEVTFPTSVMAYSSPPNVCGSGDIQLRLGTVMPLAAGITYQWKSSSTEDGTYANVGSPLSALAGPTTTVVGVDEDTYFRCYVLCEGNPILISDAVFVQSVNLEDVEISMEDGQTCGPGPVTLSGSTTDGSIFWYENPEGGSPIAMGDEFTTPLLTADKTYYATGGAFGASDGVVGTGTGTSNMYDFGLFAPYGGAKAMQYMYTKADLNEAGMTMGGDIESVAFNLAAAPTVDLTEYTIKIKTVTTGPPMSWQTSGWTTVYGPATFSPSETGWQVFPFSTPFEWNGLDNIIIQICFKTPDLGSVYTGASGTHKFTSKPGQGRHYPSWSTTSDACSSSWGDTYYNNALPNARFFIPGCETERVPVTAYVRPVPAPVNIGADETVCKDPDGSRTLDVGTLPETYTRLWNTEETTQTIRITESGTYSIIVANEFGCEVYDTVVKTLLEIPIVDLGEDMTVCEGGFVTLDAGDDGAYYMWNTGATTNTYEAYSEGTYNVLVENSAGCISLDTITLVFEGHMPGIGSIITTNVGSHTFNFEPILVNEYVTRYEWDFGDSSAISESENPTHTYAEPGSYTVTLTVYSSCGEMTYTTTTHILGVNDANIDDKSVNLYPNPAKDIAVIESKGNLKMKTVTVTNVLGQVMYQGEATAANKHQLELSAYASGLYTVRIETDKGFIVRKFEIIK